MCRVGTFVSNEVPQYTDPPAGDNAKAPLKYGTFDNVLRAAYGFWVSGLVPWTKKCHHDLVPLSDKNPVAAQEAHHSRRRKLKICLVAQWDYPLVTRGLIASEKVECPYASVSSHRSAP